MPEPGFGAQAQSRQHEVDIQALKDGWAAELRRQREAWAAAESGRRNAWVLHKTREIKESTARVRDRWARDRPYMAAASGYFFVVSSNLLMFTSLNKSQIYHT